MIPTKSAPCGISVSHERRRSELDTFARHLGFVLPAKLGDGLIPDVVLSHGVFRNRLFVADAKHTEKPDDRASIGRVSSYVSRLEMLKGTHIVAIACGGGFGRGWAEVLTGLISEAGLACHMSPWIRKLHLGTELVAFQVAPFSTESRVDRGDELGTLGRWDS